MSVQPPGRGTIISVRGPRTIYPSEKTGSGLVQAGSQPGPSVETAQAGRPATAGSGMASGDRSSVEIVGQQSKPQSGPPTGHERRAGGSALPKGLVFDMRPVDAILVELVNLESQTSALRHRYGNVIRDITDLYLNSKFFSIEYGFSTDLF